jgi:cytochrome c-type biogenesis protein CcmF
MQVLDLGRHLLLVAVFVNLAIVALALAGIALKDRRFVVSARMGFYALLVLIGGSAGCLIHGFVTGQYNNEYIYQYSERVLATPFKFTGLWAGLSGSILFWTLILSIYSAVAALQHRWSSRHPVGRRVEPYVYVVLSLVLLFFVIMTFYVTNPFQEIPFEKRMTMNPSQISPEGALLDGRGLNPQLENYWMAIHPPILYCGLVGFAIPFAFALGSLMAGEMGDYWVKITRRWTLVVWSFLTTGVILGGLWAYEMLGWGGYWAWDPVENASILPWFVGTAFLHSVMVQERRDMLKGWNVFLVTLTFFMTIVATYMTRSGVVASVHAFSEGSVSKYFIGFMIVILVAGGFLIGYRAPFLRARHRLESFFSREAAFFFNNLVLVALMATVYFMSMFQKISHDFFASELSVGPPAYNIVTTPLFLLLLLLTGVGPQLGWVKTSARLFWKRVLWPAFVGGVASLAALPQWLTHDTLDSPFTDAGIDWWNLVEKVHYYSMLAGLGLAVFIIGTVVAEAYRGVRSRTRFRHEGVAQATIRLILGNNRRYGGYLVHVGLAILAIGVIWSANFRVQDEMTIERGKPTPIPNTDLTVSWVGVDPVPSGRPYVGEDYTFEIQHAGVTMATLNPSYRRYNRQEVVELRTPSISRNFIYDYYIYSHIHDPGRNTIGFSIFVNPLINWIWAGAVIMLLGGLFAALPMPRRRLGLVD